MEAIESFIIVTNRNNIIVELNKNALGLYGSNYIGKSIYEILPKDSINKFSLSEPLRYFYCEISKKFYEYCIGFINDKIIYTFYDLAKAIALNRFVYNNRHQIAEVYTLTINPSRCEILYNSGSLCSVSTYKNDYSDFLLFLHDNIHRDDREIFKTFLSTNSLLDVKNNNKLESIIVRRKDNLGKFIEVRYILSFISSVYSSSERWLLAIELVKLDKPLFDDFSRLYTLDRFTLMSESLQLSLKNQMGILININNFQKIGNIYGDFVKKEIIDDFYDIVSNFCKTNGGIIGSMYESKYIYYFENNKEILDLLINSINKLSEKYVNYNLTFTYACFIADTTEETISLILDKCLMALDTVEQFNQNQQVIYSDDMLSKIEGPNLKLTSIKKGILNNEFTFYLQPQCDIDGKILSCEALVRWHNSRGVVTPGAFVPFLEENGLIQELDLYVWEAVCKFQRDSIDKGKKVLPISINVSRNDIAAFEVDKKLLELIKKYDLKPNLIEIEITESAYSKDINLINNVVSKLREAGFKVLMDDFGSGYSNLNMLAHIDVDVIKVDMQFIKNYSNDNATKEVLKSIIDIGEKLNKKLIFEGVESLEQYNLIKNLGGKVIQGYYFYKPFPSENLDNILS